MATNRLEVTNKDIQKGSGVWSTPEFAFSSRTCSSSNLLTYLNDCINWMTFNQVLGSPGQK